MKDFMIYYKKPLPCFQGQIALILLVSLLKKRKGTLAGVSHS